MEEAVKKSKNTPDKKTFLIEDVKLNKDLALGKLNDLFNKYIENNELKKANNLSYWLSQYSTYLDFEDDFDSTKLKSYKYGDVIKANLGYRIGDEEGGLHYCLVIDKKNNLNSKVITVIPLTSFKEGKRIHKSSVLLGDEIYLNLKEKFDNCEKKFMHTVSEVIALKDKMSDPSSEELNAYTTKLNSAMEDLNFLNKIQKEVEKMKKGSVALVNQITTISKQKIYDPQSYKDILSGLSLSEESLKLISQKINQLFVKNFK